MNIDLLTEKLVYYSVQGNCYKPEAYTCWLMRIDVPEVYLIGFISVQCIFICQCLSANILIEYYRGE